jgi:outer membrane lipoprotein LolB
VRGLGLVCLCGLLAACAAVPPVPSSLAEQRWQERRQALEKLRDWTLNGRIALQTEQEAWNASIFWQQRGTAFDIKLIGPLGQGTLTIEGDPSGVRLRTPEGKLLAARDAETLLYQQLGWRMPLSGLCYWVRGLPAPALPFNKQIDGEGRLSGLEQGGWRIAYLRYQHEGAPDLPGLPDLPGKVFLENSEITVRLVVQHWS